MNAKITVIYDEGALEGTSLIGAQGSSFLIESDGERILFGAGHRPRYMEHNMYDLGVDPESITSVVVADRHPDEWAGIGGLLKGRETPVKIRAPTSVWGEKSFLGASGMYLPKDYAGMGDRDDLMPGWTKLCEHVYVGVFGNDTFQEAVLVIRAAKGPVVISSRCLSGMKSIFEAVEDRFNRMPVAYIGGLDIGKKNDALCDAVAGYLREVGCKDLRFNGCVKPIGINRIRVTLGLEGVSNFYVGESAEYSL